MRGEIQQGQDGSVHHATRLREDKNAHGGALLHHRLAAEQEVRLRAGCVQDVNKVRLALTFYASLRFLHSFSYLRAGLTSPLSNPDVWEDIKFPSETVENELKSYIGKRLTPQPTKVRADVEVTCFGYDGIDAVKGALRAAEAQNRPDAQVKVKLVSPPLYVLTSQCLEKATGLALLERAIKGIEANITDAGGGCVVRMAPKAVTESDDAELQALMEKRERENQEVSGDEDESDSDEGPVTETI